MLESILTLIILFVIFTAAIVLIGYVSTKNHFGSGTYNENKKIK